MERTQAEWQSLIRQQHKSGLTATQFCKNHGLSMSYFSLQKKKLKKDSSSTPQKSNFVQIASPPTPAPAIQLHLNGLNISLPAAYPTDALITLIRAFC